MTSDTPETDAAHAKINEYRLDNQDVVPASFARKLERERNELIEALSLKATELAGSSCFVKLFKDKEAENSQLRWVAKSLASACSRAKSQIIADNSGCYPLPHGEASMMRRMTCDHIGDALFQYYSLPNADEKGNP